MVFVGRGGFVAVAVGGRAVLVGVGALAAVAVGGRGVLVGTGVLVGAAVPTWKGVQVVYAFSVPHAAVKTPNLSVYVPALCVRGTGQAPTIVEVPAATLTPYCGE